MKLLMLYGINCTKDIWNYLNPYLAEYDIEYVMYPHDIMIKANKVDDLTKWVYENYQHSYDAIIGHSLGGIIALQLVANYQLKTNKIICLDTNLKPAEDFYKNLMTKENVEKYSNFVLHMFDNERKFYTSKLISSVQAEFDYTNLLTEISQSVIVIYGDRGNPDYPNKLTDLNLSLQTQERLQIKFIKGACHMIMVENPKELSEITKSVLQE